MQRILLAGIICIGAAAAASQDASAASGYEVDGVALGASLAQPGAYSCKRSEEYADYTWCERKQRGGRHGGSNATVSVLHAPGGAAAYVKREIRHPSVGENDVQRESLRLAANFGVPARVIRLPEHQKVAIAMIAVWGTLQLQELDRDARLALAAGTLSPPRLIVDHLGDVSQSLQLGLPVYQLKAGRGYLWSASRQNGRGQLRFLAVDVAALIEAAGSAERAADKSALPAAEFAPASAESTKPRRVQSNRAASDASNDLRPFLTQQPTSSIPTAALKVVSGAAQQQAAQARRAEADRVRLLDAERSAADERAKAQLAWTRVQADKLAEEAAARLMRFGIASFALLLALVTLVRGAMRQAPPPYRFAASAQARRLGRPQDWAHRAGIFLQQAGAPFAVLITKRRTSPAQGSLLASG
jgi:hypothetical protein